MSTIFVFVFSFSSCFSTDLFGGSVHRQSGEGKIILRVCVRVSGDLRLSVWKKCTSL